MSLTVKLLNNSPYKPSEVNPKMGTNYEMYGKVIEVLAYYDEDISHIITTLGDLSEILTQLNHNSYNINVQWKNKEYNTYNLEDLCLYDYEDGSTIPLKSIINNKKNVFKSIW